MPWAITLHVTDCKTKGDLQGAFVTDGVSTYYTDFYGHFTAIVYDDTVIGWGVNVGKVGYVTAYTVLYKSDAGKTKDVCISPSPPSTDDGTTHNGCFVVSATTGSPASAENMRLNMLRERVLQSTDIGASLLDAIYREYYSFSPPIADELAADPELRDQVLEVAVRPLLAWYGLIEVMVLDRDVPGALERAADAVLETCWAATYASPATAAPLIDAICRGEPLSGDPPEPFRYLSSRLRPAAGLRFAAWSMFEPLALAWRCANTGDDVVRAAAQWLADAPLDRLPAPSPGARLDGELDQLAHGPFASLPLRLEVGARLAAKWPHLDDALARHGFLEGGVRLER
jgi:hypothetical protein